MLERLRGLGPEALSDHELLALVLGRRHDALALATRILLDQGGIEGLTGLECGELTSVPGLGRGLAARLCAAFELGRRAWRPRLAIGASLRCAEDAAHHFRGLLRGRRHEEFHSLLLDSRHHVIGNRLVSIGSLQSSVVHPREVFRPAIQTSAAALVVAHNHPSGDPAPSEEDHAITERLRDAGRLIGIELIDHIVIGAGSFYSFAEQQVLSLAD